MRNVPAKSADIVHHSFSPQQGVVATPLTIDHAMPVMDVSARNDWSQVRVWDMRSKAFGRVYAVSGFIAKHAMMQAAND